MRLLITKQININHNVLVCYCKLGRSWFDWVKQGRKINLQRPSLQKSPSTQTSGVTFLCWKSLWVNHSGAKISYTSSEIKTTLSFAFFKPHTSTATVTLNTSAKLTYMKHISMHLEDLNYLWFTEPSFKCSCHDRLKVPHYRCVLQWIPYVSTMTKLHLLSNDSLVDLSKEAQYKLQVPHNKVKHCTATCASHGQKNPPHLWMLNWKNTTTRSVFTEQVRFRLETRVESFIWSSLIIFVAPDFYQCAIKNITSPVQNDTFCVTGIYNFSLA